MPRPKGITGLHQRTIDRIHILVRLELANPLLSHNEIAALVGLSSASFTRLKKLPHYKQIHNQYFSGVITRLNDKVDENLGATRETLKFAVPLAMQNLLKQAMQEKDLRVQNKACNDILDRDGHFAKVTRVGLATGDQGGVADTKDNETAQALLSAMQKAKNQSTNITDPPLTETTQ